VISFSQAYHHQALVQANVPMGVWLIKASALLHTLSMQRIPKLSVPVAQLTTAHPSPAPSIPPVRLSIFLCHNHAAQERWPWHAQDIVHVSASGLVLLRPEISHWLATGIFHMTVSAVCLCARPCTCLIVETSPTHCQNKDMHGYAIVT